MNLRQKYKKLKQSLSKNLFGYVKQIVIETDEENPTPIVILTDKPKDGEPFKIYGNYRVRFSFGEKQEPEYLKNMTTVRLVEELSQREGVEKIIIEPYENKEIAVNGPMIVLKVID